MTTRSEDLPSRRAAHWGGTWAVVAILVAATGVVAGAGALVDGLPVLMAAVVAGLVLGRLLSQRHVRASATMTGSLLRLGVVLVGFRLTVGDLLGLGPVGLVTVVTMVAAAFWLTYQLGRRLRVGSELSLLVAAGFSICGASAVAAVNCAVEAKEEDVAYSLALITLCGTVSMIALPIVGAAVGMAPAMVGAWAGAGIHDVGQVVAAGQIHGPQSLEAAVVVKLSRVVLLAPMVAAVAVARRRTLSDPGRNRDPGFGFH